MASKLIQVRETLASHPDLIVVGVNDDGPKFGFAQQFHFFVAVRTPLWHDQHLNQLLAGMIPKDLGPELERKFRKQDTAMEIGNIIVRESLAEIRRDMVFLAEEDPDMPVHLKFKAADIKREPVEVAFKRCINIHLFPTVELARASLVREDPDRKVDLPASERPKAQSFS